MKTILVILASFAAIIIAGTSLGEVKIKQVPLTWQQAALTDGADLYLELCAVCHGKAGKGDGPAAAAMSKTVPDLTVLAADNDGVFPRKAVEDSIAGKSRVVSHGTIDMPIWGQAFEGVRPDWKQFRREGYAKQRIFNLAEYLESIQAE